MAKKPVEPIEESPTFKVENAPLVSSDVVINVPPYIKAPPVDEPMQRVSFVLPRRVLYALIDPSHPEADKERAYILGLLELQGDSVGVFVTELGKLVIEGTDVTALRHKMLAGWREQHNKEVDGKK